MIVGGCCGVAAIGFMVWGKRMRASEQTACEASTSKEMVAEEPPLSIATSEAAEGC